MNCKERFRTLRIWELLTESGRVEAVTRYDIPQPVVVERNACNTLLTLSGYCTNNEWPASFICTSQAPGIFPAITKELADAIVTSSVPVMIKVGLDIFESSSQMPLQLGAVQFCAMSFCCLMVLGGIPANKSLASGTA